MIKALYNLDNRSINLASFGICLFSLILAKYYFEEFLGLEPCYLCITQRIFLLLAGIVFLTSTIHNPKNLFKKVYSYVAIFFCSAGAYFSIKQFIFQIMKKPIFDDFQIALLSGILIYLWPFSPNGNFFNNWLTIIHCLTIAFFIWSFSNRTKKNLNFRE